MPAASIRAASIAAMASNSSLRRRTLMDRSARTRDLGSEVRVADAARVDQVNRSAEQRLQRVGQVEQPLRSRTRSGRVEFDQEVVVALSSHETARCRRAEQLQTTDTKAPTELADRPLMAAQNAMGRIHRTTIGLFGPSAGTVPATLSPSTPPAPRRASSSRRRTACGCSPCRRAGCRRRRSRSPCCAS